MEIQNKTNAELINELRELLIQNNSLKAIVKNLELELINSNKKNVFQNQEKKNRLAELVIANKQLTFQNNEKQKREDELIIINKELVFQNEEKQKRADELVIDITQHKQAEQALKESEQKFRDLSNNITQLVWIADAQGYIFWYNRRWFDFTGTSLEEMKGWGWQKVHHPDHVQSVVDKIKYSFETGEIWEDTFPLRGKDGKYRWFLSRAVPIRDEHGTILRWFGTNTDVTENKQAEQALKESETKYRLQSEEKEKRAAELIIANKELAFQNQEKKNRAAELVFANKELTFQNQEKKNRAAELVIANKELAFQNQEKENRAAELVIANKELAFQNQEKEKRAAKLIISNKQLVKAEMEIRKFNKTLEKKVESRTAELVNTNKDLQQFAYVATHDLQEPLRMISSYTQLLERKYKDKLDQDAKDYIHFAVDGAIRMQSLLNDLLEFSRIQTSEKGFDLINTLTVLGKAISNIQLLIIENNALVTNDDLPILKADESQILRVFQNLIENAIKFKKKTELPKIHISCKKLKNMFQFSVSDNGIGMEMQYHDRIFIIFQRLHSVKDYPGTGMGLAICKRIIEKHGGLIWFESIVDKGTTFYFTIPE